MRRGRIPTETSGGHMHSGSQWASEQAGPLKLLYEYGARLRRFESESRYID